MCVFLCFMKHVPICKGTNLSKDFNNVYDMIIAWNFDGVRPLFTTDIQAMPVVHNVLQMKKILYIYIIMVVITNIQILCI